jgi:hypothetical protein
MAIPESVPARVTAGSLVELADSMRAALPGLSSHGVAKLLAQAMFETANFNSCYNYNVGNLRPKESELYFMHPGRVNENIDGNRVEAQGSEDPIRKFRAFESWEEGIAAWASLIQRAYPLAWEKVVDDSANCYSFAYALGEPNARGLHYYTDNQSHYAKGTAARYPAAREAVEGREGWPTIRLGSTGPLVVEWQKILVRHGLAVVLDGQFGPRTQAATEVFQVQHSLTADGVVGPITWGAGRAWALAVSTT